MSYSIDPGVRPLTDREFHRFQRLIHDDAGIYLSDAKKALVTGRLIRRLRTLGLQTFSSYLELIESDGGNDERAEMLDCICTNETHFFREPRQFEFLDEQILPRWKELAASGAMQKRIRAWSAACSTGEEPYSVAMLLRTHFPLSEGWQVAVVASDLSGKAISAAREGVWRIDAAEKIPPAYRRAYMLRGIRSAEGTMRARPELQSIIDFRRINLSEPSYRIDGTFNLIFCRNVLIYFDRETKNAVIDRLSRLLSAGGLLLLGHAETITGPDHGLQHVGPATYRRV